MRASVHVDLPGWTKEGLPALKVWTLTCASSIHSNPLSPLPTVHFLILSPLLIITIFERIFSVLQKRCEELHIQPRGTRGESGGQTGGDNIQCSTVVYRIAILSGTFDRPAFRIIQKTDVVYAVRVSGRIFINSELIFFLLLNNCIQAFSVTRKFINKIQLHKLDLIGYPGFLLTACLTGCPYAYILRLPYLVGIRPDILE